MSPDTVYDCHINVDNCALRVMVLSLGELFKALDFLFACYLHKLAY